MKSPLSNGIAVAALLVGCWSLGVFAEPVMEPAPAAPQEIEIKLTEAQRPEASPQEADEMVASRPPIAHKPAGPRVSQLKLALAGLWLRGMAVVASSQPPTIPTGVVTYPDQPRLDVSWSLQGLADEEDQGGEGDIIDYDG